MDNKFAQQLKKRCPGYGGPQIGAGEEHLRI